MAAITRAASIKRLGHDPQRPDGHYPDGPHKYKVGPIQCVRCQAAWPCENAVQA